MILVFGRLQVPTIAVGGGARTGHQNGLEGGREGGREKRGEHIRIR